MNAVPAIDFHGQTAGTSRPFARVKSGIADVSVVREAWATKQATRSVSTAPVFR